MRPNRLSSEQASIVRGRVDALLNQSEAFSRLSRPEREEIAAHTAQVAGALAAQPGARDPYAFPARGLAEVRLGRDRLGERNIRASDPFRAEAALAGAAAAGALVQEVNFTRFVTELVDGVFHSIVQSSMDQMKAYGELVKSVVSSLNEFRDENVSVNQGRDHLVSRFPNLFQISVMDDQPRVTARDGAEFADLPDFAGEFGLDEEITDIDEETIEQKLVPAARDSLAQSRQKLLATMVLMGINRIVVTDGRINAKVRFKFSARDTMSRMQTAVDYENFGTTYVTTKGSEEEEAVPGEDTYDEDGNLLKTGEGNKYATDFEATIEKPLIQITDQTQAKTEAEIVSSGNLTGEVQLNFRSETLPLERMLDTNQVTRLNELGAGHGAPPPGAAGAATAQPSPTPPAPVPPTP